MTGSYIDHEVWQAAEEIPFNPDGAIYKYWRELRASGQYLGVPVTPEIETPVGVQQGFSSGVVLCWSPEEGATIASD
jgi:hypothetical protein